MKQMPGKLYCKYLSTAAIIAIPEELQDFQEKLLVSNHPNCTSMLRSEALFILSLYLWVLNEVLNT